MALLRLVREDGSPISRRFETLVQISIVFSMITFSIETIPDIDPMLRSALWTAEIVIVIFFTAEYLLRLWNASDKLRHVTSPMALIDLFAILPFYLSLGLDLRCLRILRLFRMFRAFKMLRYTKALDRFVAAFVGIREELTLFIMATAFLLYLAAVGIYYFEHEAQPEAFSSVFHSLWWSVITFTTVGYGDVYPVTLGGRLFTFFVLIIGLGVIAVPSGLVASALSRAVHHPEDDRD